MQAGDLRVLWTLVRGQPRHGGLRQRLEAFYRPQATRYDTFRERMLHGRQRLLDLLDIRPNHYVVELGGGTGRNLDYLGERLAGLRRVDVVDLCPALLEQARRRAQHRANVVIVDADATAYRPAEPVDRVFFAYSLTMMPNWQDALENARAMLRPGGLVGVVDFYVAERVSETRAGPHGPLTRRFWPWWFAHDGVLLNPQHLASLARRFQTVHRGEHRGPLPFLPGLRVPYYLFVGRKPAQ